MDSIGTLEEGWLYNDKDDFEELNDTEGKVGDDEYEDWDGMSDASRNWAKDGVGLLHWGQRHLGAIHDSCN